MFKNNKEKENNYISTEDVEKMYKFQKKNFDVKIAEQQERIDNLVNYVSARFGEEVLDSEIGVRLKNFENSLNQIEINYKDNLKRNENELRKEITKECKRIATELNNSQAESFLRFLQSNDLDLIKIQKFLEEKNNNDSKILNLDSLVKTHIMTSEKSRKEIYDELKNTNQKISKISYAGVTSKFDKKIKEECSKLDEQFIQKLGQVQENLQSNGNEIIKLQEMFINENEKVNSSLDDHINKIAALNERLSEEVENIGHNIKKVDIQTEKLDDKFTTEIDAINQNLVNTNESVDKLDKTINSKYEMIDVIAQGVDQLIKDFKADLNKEKQTTNLLIKNTEDITNKLDEKFTQKIEKIELNSKSNEEGINKLDKKIIKELESLNKELQNSKQLVSDLEQEVTKKLAENLKNDAQASEIEKKLSSKIANVALNIKNNQTQTTDLKEDLTNKILQTRDAVNKLKDIAKNKNAKLEAKIKETNENLKFVETNLISKVEDIKKQANNIYAKFETDANTKIDAKIQEAMGNIGGSKLELSKIETKILKQNKKDILDETEKIKTELNEQLTNNYNDTKVELESISENIDDIRNSMEDTIKTVGAEVLKLKKEVKQSLQNENNVDIELLKKDYNKYIVKVNNELAKISKDLLNAQKKNQEQNRNLQVKIKTYIDAKIENSNNIGNIEELINNLNISILEREKIQKLEMEELLNKKLKAIQKENARLINKKIEEMSAEFIRQNKTNTRVKPNTITLYEELPTKKKNMYDFIDDKQILKRSATSKKPSLPAKDKQSQILKFFYDEEDEF